MSRTHALLRYGLWPDIPVSAKEPVELTTAARARGLHAIEELSRLGVTVTIEDGRLRFRSSRVVMPAAARRIVETHGHLLEAVLRQGETAP
jgi:hypothetical protein